MKVGYVMKSFEILCTYMDDEIREELHFKMSHCTELEFLKAYYQIALKKDLEFINILKNEFEEIYDLI